MNEKRVLISGGGIAGLTLAIELKKSGFAPLVIEREPAPRSEGYMMDFFGAGWDAAGRMGLLKRLRAIRYPIDAIEFVDADGKPFVRAPIERIRAALDGKYLYLRRPDLERVLAERAKKAGVEIRYGAALVNIRDNADSVAVRFENGSTDTFALVIGADGVHSRVRRLVFGLEQEFARFLGLYVVAFHTPIQDDAIGRAAKVFEQPDRMALFYPLDARRMDAVYIFRHPPVDVPSDRRLAFTRERFRDAGWIAGDVLRQAPDDKAIYFDSATQIVMPEWHRGRVALVGDACGCLTLIAGQGAHMAMAGAYVLAHELARQPDHTTAFASYQAFVKPHVDRKQKEAARLARIFVPTQNSRPWLRRLAMRLLFSRTLMKRGLAFLGADNILAGRDTQ